MLTGTIVNTAAVLVGTVLGRTALQRLPAEWHDSALRAVGLVVIVIGLSTALPAFASWTVFIILSMVAGTLVGEAVGLERGMERLEAWSERTFGPSRGGWARAALAATLIFCVGPMAILGAIQDGMGLSHGTLFAKSALDGLTSVALAATLGAGVALAAIPVFVYQGAWAVAAHFAAGGLDPAIATVLSGVGGTLIAAIGLGMTGATRLRVASMLPALLIAPLAVWVDLQVVRP